ncbi:MAG: DNA polymerase III subunit delta [Clostridia bacterium]|nr:DNA polymerase III subunit delta [Clostridia bacterium]
MKAEEFLKKPEILSQLFVVYGEERYLAVKVKDAIINALDCGELNIDRRRENAALEDIVTIAEQAPCCSDCRIVVLDEPGVIKGLEAEAFTEYIKSMPTSTKMIFLMKNLPDKRRSFYKYLEKNALMIEAYELDDETMCRWIVSQAGKKGISVKKGDAALMLEICGRDMLSLDCELEKLSCLGKKAIDISDIYEVVSLTTDYNVFLLHEHMLQGSYKKAFDLTKKIYADEKTYIPVVALLSNKFEQMLAAKLSVAGGRSKYETIQSVSKELKVKPGAVGYAVDECAAFSIEALKRSVERLSNYEYALKSGGANAGIEALLMEIYKTE